MGDPASVFKAYDIRGLVPEELDESLVRDLGSAFALLVREVEPTTDRVVVARDMRATGQVLAGAFADGVRAQGIDVVDIGLAHTALKEVLAPWAYRNLDELPEFAGSGASSPASVILHPR